MRCLEDESRFYGDDAEMIVQLPDVDHAVKRRCSGRLPESMPPAGEKNAGLTIDLGYACGAAGWSCAGLYRCARA